MTPRDPAAAAKVRAAVADAVLQIKLQQSLRITARAGERVLAALPWAAGAGVAAVFAAGYGLGLRAPFWAPAAALLGGAGLAFAIGRAVLHAAVPGAAEGAAAVDRANDNRDRLGAALEFAAGEAPAAAPSAREQLVRAAIDDGLQSLQRIDPHRLPAAAPLRPWRWRRAAAAWLALLLAPLAVPEPGPAEPGTTVAAVDPQGGRAPAPAARERDARAPAAAAPSRPELRPEPPRPPEPPREAPVVPTAPPPAAAAAAVPASSGTGRSGSEAAGDSTPNAPPKAAPAGDPGAGRSGAGQGAAASGAPQPSPQTPPPPRAATKPRPPAKPQPQPETPPKAGESAGAPSGSARGSGRASAVANQRIDQNRGQEREDDPPVEDEPVEDEAEDQEQRGGVTPLRRGDNRPAARELSISGDGPPDQGRGGPTPPKKARGTASLVLGLRLPDAVRGQPNPGAAKTSLEQVPPLPSSAALGPASAAPAQRPATPQSPRRPGSPAWLVHAYHAALRARDPAAPAAPTADPAATRR